MTAYRVISLAGAATKHVFCRDKNMLVATNTCLFLFLDFDLKLHFQFWFLFYLFVVATVV